MNPVEANAWTLLSILVEQDIRNYCSNEELQSRSGIENAYDVNDALEWLERRSAIKAIWMQSFGGSASARIQLKGEGKSMYYTHKNQIKPESSSSFANTTNIYGNVGNVALNSKDFEQHANERSDTTPSITVTPRSNSIDPKSVSSTAVNAEKDPTAFISYAWEDDQHKKWVKKIAADLRRDGVDVKLDQWDLVPGDQLTQFMEKAISENDFIVIICTPKYKEKSDLRSGGVGYEGDIMTAQVYSTNNQRKFIPILRQGDWETSSPTWLKGKYYIDLRESAKTESQYDALLKALHQIADNVPEIGKIPDRLYQK